MKYAGKLSRMGRRGLIDTNEVKCKANALPEGTMLRLSVTVARMTPKTLFIFAALAMGNYAASTTSRPFPSFLTKIVCFFNSAWRSCAMKKNDGKRPSFQFYPADWMKDPALKLCSHNAKGIWMDLICIAFEMPTKGVFLISKKPISEIKLLQMLNGNEKSKKSGFQELKRHGVIKRNKDNVFYCKRLYNDMRLSEIRREVGKLGGNPDLLNQNDNQSPTPSTSTSNSTPTSTIEIDKKEALGKERLGLNKEVKIRAVKFGEELDRIFPNISRDEATTFLRVAQHLTEEVILGVGLEIFDEAVVWAKQAMSGNARNPKGLFVAKVKEQTGFTGRGMLLDRKE